MKTMHVILAILMVAMAAAPALADRTKVSYKGQDLQPGCPNDQTTALIKVGVTDATRAMVGDTPRRVRGEAGFTDGEGIAASTMYLMCYGVYRVDMEHESVSFTTDESNQTSFTSIDITSYDQDQIDAITPTIDQAGVWCDLYIPETGGCTWQFPNGMRLDREPPDVTYPNLIVDPMVAYSGGNVNLTWNFYDSGTPWDDPAYGGDGENGNLCPQCSGLGCHMCNKSDTRFQWQYFRRSSSGSYTTVAEGSTSGELYEVLDDDETTTKDRFTSSPDEVCYVLRIQDSAGNWSIEASDLNIAGTATKLQEKCIRPDGRNPEIERIDFYTTFDSNPATGGFSGQFPFDTFGDAHLTTNPCHFFATCSITMDRYIEMKLTVSEPLFDGVNPYGYTIIWGDGVDNDADGSIDEETGGFDQANNDTDDFTDEDVAVTTTRYDSTMPPYGVNDKVDNDADGYVDEHHANNPGVAPYDDSTSRFCAINTLFNRAQSDADTTTCVDIPQIFVDGVDTEGRVNGSEIEWVCTQDGSTTHPDCASLDYGKSIYRYRWRVGRATPNDIPPVGLEEGEYNITISAVDGVGNFIEEEAPTLSGTIWIDNSAPELSVSYYSDSAFFTKYKTTNHDNDTNTPNMPIVATKNVYIEVTSKEGDGDMEYLGATPTMYIFLPNSAAPAYEGTPQPGNGQQMTLYTTCNQNASCDPCSGTNCIAYNATTDPCNVFRTCFKADTSTNNGYAAVTIVAEDRLHNRSWHASDAQAAADQFDADKKRDDTGINGTVGGAGDPDAYEDDGIASFYYLSATSSAMVEPDIAIESGQYFAIDTIAPATPAISLPVAPCNGIIARTNGCLDDAETTNSPTIKWTTLANTYDDDLDGTTNDECIDGIDNDGDGRIDEDGLACNPTDTRSWEISQWNLQVSTTPTFASGTLVANTIVAGLSYTVNGLAERPIETPYYWRIAPYDYAGNKGPYNPQYPLVDVDKPYYSFGVDTTPPEVTIEYFLDKDCSESSRMPRTADGIPITGDTANDPDDIVCMKITTNEPVATSTALPQIQTMQLGFDMQATTAIAFPATSTTSFRAWLEIATRGSYNPKYQDGQVQVVVTTADRYFNELDEEAPASGSVFLVDSAAPECLMDAPFPDPASQNNDGDNKINEMLQDAVTMSFTCNKYIGDTLHLRVVQNGFNETPISNDGLDNDCDGLIDEESGPTTDLDGDGKIGEDTGTYGGASGSGCYITTKLATGTQYTYTGLYNVVAGNYDGTANVYLGDTDPTSDYFLVDLVGNPVYANTTFVVDTTAPGAPTIKSPVHQQVLDDALPQFKWEMSPRADDLKQYKLEIATASNFANLFATATINDDGASTLWQYTVQKTDILECYDTSIYGPDPTLCPAQCYATDPFPPSCYGSSPDPLLCPAACFSTDPLDASCYDTNPLNYCPGLSDNTYYWRISAYDQANNKSSSSLVVEFKVDTQPPDPPVFNAVTTPTTQSVVPLSGYTSPAEPNGKVSIFVNDKFYGTVTTDSEGKFTVGIDDDKDGTTDEDPVDGTDNDYDDSIDEDPPGIFLREGDNIIEGIVTDSGGNQGSQGCDSATPFYVASSGKCIIKLDSGAPNFVITYYNSEDMEAGDLLPVIDYDSGKQVASATTVFMFITASEPLIQDSTINPPTFSVDFQGTSDLSNRTTTSLDASGTQFMGQFTVSAHNPDTYVDGDAKIIVIGTDSEGNTTDPDMLPSYGAYLNIDTQAPFFRITYWEDENLKVRMRTDYQTGEPLTKAGYAYMRITANEPLSSVPTVNVDQPGGTDIAEAATQIDTDGYVFKYAYKVYASDGSNYRDGIASVTISGTDRAGNIATNATPTQGDSFLIDTIAPQPPTITLETEETNYTYVNVSGFVYDLSSGSSVAEQYANVELYTSLFHENLRTIIVSDDGTDNDGDGRADEEPVDGVDNDGDLFIDEDPTANPCDADEIWDYIFSECIDALSTPIQPDGTATTNSSGGYSSKVTGLLSGVNYVYARATDLAGNISDMSSGSAVVATPVQLEEISHTFPAGWNLVGVPMQPSQASPNAAMGLPNDSLFQYKNGKYIYNVGLDAISPGLCYWAYFAAEQEITLKGLRSTTNIVKLTKGWNLISLPYNQSVAFDEEHVKVSATSSSTAYALGTEDADKYVEAKIYTYDGTTDPGEYIGPIELDDAVVIAPWEGFAIRAYKDCWIVFPSMFEIPAGD